MSGYTIALNQVEKLPYSGKLLREKTFANSVVLWLYAKVFSVKFGGVAASFGVAKASNPQKFFTNLRRFSPLKVSYYTVCTRYTQ